MSCKGPVDVFRLHLVVEVRHGDNPHMDSRRFSKELKKGSADLLILALLKGRDRHGDEIGRLMARLLLALDRVAGLQRS